MDYVLSHFLCLLHPFMPHITEELWERLGFTGVNHAVGNLVMYTDYPTKPVLPEGGVVAEVQAQVAAVYETVGAARNLRAEFRVPSSKKIDFVLKPAVTWIKDHLPTFARLVNAEEVSVQPGYQGTPSVPRVLTPLGELYMPLEGVVDTGAELERLNKEIAKVENELTVVHKKLANESFVANAPAAVVTEHRQRESDWAEKLAQLTRMRDALGN
jgi:valyl-tRNA synthetase